LLPTSKANASLNLPVLLLKIGRFPSLSIGEYFESVVVVNTAKTACMTRASGSYLPPTEMIALSLPLSCPSMAGKITFHGHVTTSLAIMHTGLAADADVADAVTNINASHQQ